MPSLNPFSMKTTQFLFCALALAVGTAKAQPSDQSIERLMTLTAMESLTETMMGQLEQAMRQGMSGAVRGKSLTQEQQRAIELAPVKIAQAMRSELNWQNLKPIYVTVYRESFTQEEVDGMIEFYKTPVGQATIKKMPVVMQKSMQMTQARMQTLLPKLEAAIKQALAEAGVPQ